MIVYIAIDRNQKIAAIFTDPEFSDEVRKDHGNVYIRKLKLEPGDPITNALIAVSVAVDIHDGEERDEPRHMEADRQAAAIAKAKKLY